VSEDQDPSNSNVMFLNKVRLLSDVDSGSLVPYTVTPSSVSASEFCLWKCCSTPWKL